MSLEAAKLKYLQLATEIRKYTKHQDSIALVNLMHTHSKLGMFLEDELGEAWTNAIPKTKILKWRTILLGVEQIQQAARTISGAAEQMQHSVMEMSGALDRHQVVMNEWLDRFESILKGHGGEAMERPTQYIGSDLMNTIIEEYNRREQKLERMVEAAKAKVRIDKHSDWCRCPICNALAALEEE